MRITSKGQVTIPVEIRERLGLLPDCEVEFVVEGKGWDAPADPADPNNHFKNRRVEISVYQIEAAP